MPDSDLSRNVYCVLGIPVDVIDMPSVVRIMKAAIVDKSRFMLSTPNVNFLVAAQTDPGFRETLLESDLCPADGMPVIWIARLIGVPLRTRVAGSDIFDSLKERRGDSDPIRVFLFGGLDGVSAAACRAINSEQGGLQCVGSCFPGYGSIEEMSGRGIIDKINSSHADLLIVSLGARKGQSWLHCNRQQLTIPIRTHLGAAINFQAGNIKRAPRVIRAVGFEWLWRIKEEPYLWRRYWSDGRTLVRMLCTRVVPLALWTIWLRLGMGPELRLEQTDSAESLTLSLSGLAIARYVERVTPAFRNAITVKKRVILDLRNTVGVDARFLGLLLVVRKALQGEGNDLVLVGLPRRLHTLFRLNGLGFMIAGE